MSASLEHAPQTLFGTLLSGITRCSGLSCVHGAPALELVISPKRWFLLLGTGFREHGLSARYVYCSCSVFAYCYWMSLHPGHVHGEMEEIEECEHTDTCMHMYIWTYTCTTHIHVLEILSSCHTSVSSPSGIGFFLHSPIPYSCALLPTVRMLACNISTVSAFLSPEIHLQ